MFNVSKSARNIYEVSPSTVTLWKPSPKQKLYFCLTTITNSTISRTARWFYDRTDLMCMPIFVKQTLFDANLINTYLDKNIENEELSCEDIAKAVNYIIESRVDSESSSENNAYGFFDDVKKVIAPYLKEKEEDACEENLEIAAPIV